MTGRDAWSLALPPPDVGSLVAQLAQGFHELADAPLSDFSFDLPEPRITKRLVIHLQTMTPLHSIVGFWDHEIPQDTPKLDDPRRLDIRWATVLDNKVTVKLVFECKKLCGSDERRHKQFLRGYTDDGISRFVRGSYAPETDIGFMVAYASSTSANVMPSVRRSLSSGSWPVTLRMMSYDDKGIWRQPAARFAEHADFETRHERKSVGFHDITLYHLALPFKP